MMILTTKEEELQQEVQPDKTPLKRKIVTKPHKKGNAPCSQLVLGTPPSPPPPIGIVGKRESWWL